MLKSNYDIDSLILFMNAVHLSVRVVDILWSPKPVIQGMKGKGVLDWMWLLWTSHVRSLVKLAIWNGSELSLLLCRLSTSKLVKLLMSGGNELN